MNKLNQLGVLVMLLVATACQASSPENQENTTTAIAAVDSKATPTPESPTQEIAVTPITDEDPLTRDNGKVITDEPQAVSAVSKRDVSTTPSTAVSANTTDDSSPKQAPVTKAPKVVQDEIKTEALTPVEKAAEEDKSEIHTEVATKVDTEVVVVDAAPSHDSWNKLLNQFVSATGKVNYRALKGKMGELEAYLKLLADNPVQASWSRNEKMAYWINAYNAFTIKLILDNYPLASITDLSGGKVWDKKWIKLGDKTYSLNNIENDILRPRYKDARIHFAVNCAAKSCPPLLNRAWTADNLNGLLSQQAKKFINNSAYNEVSPNKVVISKIFEWYAADFGNIVDYLNKYANNPIKAQAQVSYQEYDWALNQ